jgi:hypothetical protein
MAPMGSMASMELRACLSPAPRGPPDRYHRKKRFLLTSVPPPASLTEMTCTNDGVDDGSQRELTTKPRLAEGAASARDASTARQNRRNRQIYPTLHMSSRAPAREKWRPTVDLARQTPRAAGRLHERKVWQTSVLQSSTVGPAHGKMALLALKKAPFCAIFLTFRTSARDFPEYPTAKARWPGNAMTAREAARRQHAPRAHSTIAVRNVPSPSARHRPSGDHWRRHNALPPSTHPSLKSSPAHCPGLIVAISKKSAGKSPRRKSR